jgi:hypothetical protein
LLLVTTRLGLESVLCRKKQAKNQAEISPCHDARRDNFRAHPLTPLGEVDVLLVLLLGDEVRLVLGQSSSDGPGLLVTEVEGEVYRNTIELFEVSKACRAREYILDKRARSTYTWRSCSCTTP